jgi:tetratricopeptide (TPR) repeat protein
MSERRAGRGRPRPGRRVWVLLALLVLAAPVIAADRPTNEDARFQRKLDEADRDLHSGNQERALRTFEELLARRPESREAFVGVVRARLELHKLDGLAETISEKIAASPADPELMLLLGDVKAASGAREDALVSWRAAIPLFERPEEAYREAARRAEEARMFPEAIRILQDGREALANRYLFADALSQLHALTGDGEAAAKEWVRAAAAGSRKNEEALRQIRALRESGEIAAYPLEAIRAVLDSLPSAAGVREILADLYTDEGRCTEALHEFVVLDKTVPSCGRFLLPFAKEALAKGCTDDAAKAVREVIGRCEEASTRTDASFLLARIQRTAGRTEEAAETYRAIVQGTKNPKEKEAAELELANLLVNEEGDPSAAIPILEETIRKGALGDREPDIRFRLAHARLLAGDPAGALHAYDELQSASSNDVVRERALFEKGSALFFAGRLDESLAALRRVIDQYPSGRYLNDALDRSIFISENRDAGDAALAEYAASLLLIERKEFPEARRRLEAMLNTLVVAKIRDDLIWQLAMIDEGEGRYRPAIERLETLIEEFPGGRLSQSAEIRIADLYSTKLGDLPEGIARYEKFLVDHPGSVLVEEARRKLREAEKGRGL